jgi:cytochrome c oxidase assembly protein subunit 15
MELNDHKSRAVANWLLLGVIMTVIQIALGGITRLTGSGLSITEWDVVTGALPPMSEAHWQELFAKYKTTPQFQLLNFDFTISNFKFIFFWEWFHRLWARTIGLVFAIGFIYFLIKKYFKPSMIKPLLVLFFLGALQGAIGWIMVASGLEGDAVYVKPTRLALHFVFALGLLSYTYWFALSLKANTIQKSAVSPEGQVRLIKARKWAWVVIVILFFQLIIFPPLRTAPELIYTFDVIVNNAGSVVLFMVKSVNDAVIFLLVPAIRALIPFTTPPTKTGTSGSNIRDLWRWIANINNIITKHI